MEFVEAFCDGRTESSTACSTQKHLSHSYTDTKAITEAITEWECSGVEDATMLFTQRPKCLQFLFAV